MLSWLNCEPGVIWQWSSLNYPGWGRRLWARECHTVGNTRPGGKIIYCVNQQDQNCCQDCSDVHHTYKSHDGGLTQQGCNSRGHHQSYIIIVNIIVTVVMLLTWQSKETLVEAAVNPVYGPRLWMNAGGAETCTVMMMIILIMMMILMMMSMKAIMMMLLSYAWMAVESCIPSPTLLTAEHDTLAWEGFVMSITTFSWQQRW